MRRIAITGGVAAGKSTVCKIFFEDYGAYIVDADAIVDELLFPNNPIGKKVIELLGSDIVVANQINKKKISDIVFSDTNKLKALEKILHPAVRQKIRQEYDRVKDDRAYNYFVAEVPLLFEAGMESDFDSVICVMATAAHAKQRFTKTHFEERSAHLIDPAIKASRSDFVIMNDDDTTQLKSTIRQIVDKL